MSWLDGIARHLATAGAVTYNADGAAYDSGVSPPPLFLVLMPSTPDLAVTIAPYPGPQVPDRDIMFQPRMQVRVRADADPMTGLDLDDVICQALQAIGPLTLDTGEFLQDCFAMEAAPIPIGQDDQGRSETTRNYQLTLRRTLP